MAQYVTLEELKQHLNVDFDTDDTYITELIEPFQLVIEAYLNAPLEGFVKDGKIDRRIWHAIRGTHNASGIIKRNDRFLP